MIKVLCIGHAAYDITLPVDDYPVENKKIRISDKIECGGGAAANCASLLAEWGLDSYFVGAVGNDHYGDIVKKEFIEEHVKTDYLETSNKFGTSSSYIIANVSNGSRTIIISRTKHEEASMKELPNDISIIVADGEEPSLTEEAIKNNPNAISILDAGNIKPSIVRLCPQVTYVICSKDFAEEYTKQNIDINNHDTLISVYEKLKSDFNTNIIITLGESGSFTKIDKYVLIPSIKVKPVDSTAAGDIFHGAFAYFIAHNYNLYDTIILSNVTGAISTLKIGGKYSIPKLEEVYAQVHNNTL